MALQKYRCGLVPSPVAPGLRFSTYLMAATLPSIPDTFGHQNLFPRVGYGMLGNDRVGDCTVAGAMHAVMLWNKIAGRNVNFTTLDAIDDYSAISGYRPGDPSTDNGADMVAVAKYWRQTGIRDNTATRHRITAYLGVNVSLLDHVYAAAYLFDAVGLGVNITSSCEDQFDRGEPWSVVHSDSVEGMHFVPLISKSAAGLGVVTWGAFQLITEEWLRANLVEVVAYLSEESLTNGKSAEGLDLSALQGDLEAVA